MKKTNLKSIAVITLALLLSIFCLIGCGKNSAGSANLSTGGVLNLKVNPEIAISYDENGKVTAIDARNDDAKKIIADYTGFEGKECRQVIAELVTAIGKAGYLVDDVDGSNREITIEIEAGSSLPSNTFLDDVVLEVKSSVNTNSWKSPIDVRGESDYGITDYVDTDYGVGNDGYTDYNDTDYGVNNDGITDYAPSSSASGNAAVIDTDYGEGNDGVTDYNNTDYGPNNDGVTDYNDTDYGSNNDGVTDYNGGDSPYDSSTDYSGTNYGDSKYDD